jgi:hypothetical protein
LAFDGVETLFEECADGKLFFMKLKPVRLNERNIEDIV